MAKVLEIDEYLSPDDIACYIANQWVTLNSFRQNWTTSKEEILRYIFATDTTQTSNSKLPWSNKTTIPKLCQIRDNLHANYMATMFPKKKNVKWEGDTKQDSDIKKTQAIEAYMGWAMDRPEYYAEVSKIVLDYIDFGNAFVIPEWIDGRNPSSEEGGLKYGFVGPRIRRINPLDIVFNPTAPSFAESPKIIRSMVSLGEIQEILNRESKTPEEQEDAKEILKYAKGIRQYINDYPGEATTKDAIYQIAGFDTFRAYLSSNIVEILTFYGDVYIEKTGEFKRNQIIKVIDRHKIISQRENPSYFGTAPIYHVGWRIRPDNLWAQGPLDNLVGLQYRIDHLENMKADVWDLTRYPVFKIKGYAEDFEWQPGERIYIGDDGDVEVVAPDVGALQANTEIAILEQKMEEMAGSPKEAMGFRTPGEKTKYEVQRLENAASRIFQNKISQFERDLVEPSLNAQLELARRNLSATSIPIFDEDFKVTDFLSISPSDIVGNGRIRPMAARHFAEQAQLVQDLNNFFSSAIGHDPAILVHFSAKRLAQMWERLLDIEDYGVVQPYIRISEMAEAQTLQQIAMEQAQMTAGTPSGMGGDYDLQADQNSVAPGGQGPGQAPSGPVPPSIPRTV